MSRFHIEGHGTVIFYPAGPTSLEYSGESFEPFFDIVPGSGTGRYAGIAGNGKLSVANFDRQDMPVTSGGYVLRLGELSGSIEFRNILNGGDMGQ